MTTISPRIRFFLTLARFQAVMARRFDGGLDGLGFSDFMILLHLSQARGEKMRRIDLAGKIGLTASGVTRLLAPMEKIGLIRREANPADARVSIVSLAPGGKRKLAQALENAEFLAKEIISADNLKQVQETADVILALAK